MLKTMENLVIYSCTNRPESNTLKVSLAYQRLLLKQGVKADVFDFQGLPRDLAFSETFGNRTAPFDKLIQKHIIPNSKVIFIVPEYNGSFPGILKSFLDSVHPSLWRDKKACLVGVSDGRAGNLRGMDHLTGIFHYLKMNVYYDKLPISSVTKVISEGYEFSSDQELVCLRQITGFLNY